MTFTIVSFYASLSNSVKFLKILPKVVYLIRYAQVQLNKVEVSNLAIKRTKLLFVRHIEMHVFIVTKFISILSTTDELDAVDRALDGRRIRP